MKSVAKLYDRQGNEVTGDVIVSATLPATAGWYRIATSAVGIARCAGRFEIDWAVSGHHGQTIINAGIMYSKDPTLNELYYSSFSAYGLNKCRIVYHTTYTGNYAYLEVYNPGNYALVVTVQLFSSLGWMLLTPNTVGSIPAGYTALEIDLIDGICTDGIFKSSIPTGTAPLTVTSTTKVVNLNVDKLDDQEGSYYLDWNNATNKPAPVDISGVQNEINYLQKNVAELLLQNELAGKLPNLDTGLFYTDMTNNFAGSIGQIDRNKMIYIGTLSAGSTTITVATGVVQFAVGDEITIQTTIAKEVKVVQSITATTITLTAGLTNTHNTPIIYRSNVQTSGLTGHTTGSTSFSLTKQVVTSPVILENMAVCISDFGTMFSVVNRAIYSSKDAGKTWELEVTLEASGSSYDTSTCLVVGTKIYFVYGRDTFYKVGYMDYNTKAVTFLVTDGLVENIGHANMVLYGTTIWVAVMSISSGNALFVRSLDTIANTATAQTMLTSTYLAYRGGEMKMYLDSTGNPVIIATGRSNSTTYRLCRFAYNGTAWVESNIAGLTSNSWSWLSIIKQTNGIYVFVGIYNNTNMYYSTSADGITFATMTSISLATSPSGNVDLVLSGGFARVMYRASSPLGDVKYSTFNGTVWGTVGTVTSLATSIRSVKAVRDKVGQQIYSFIINETTPNTHYIWTTVPTTIAEIPSVNFDVRIKVTPKTTIDEVVCYSTLNLDAGNGVSPTVSFKAVGANDSYVAMVASAKKNLGTLEEWEMFYQNVSLTALAIIKLTITNAVSSDIVLKRILGGVA